MTKNSWNAVIALLLLAPLAAPATAEDSDKGAEFQTLNTAIETVISGGFWERKDQDGTYRLIVRRRWGG